MDNQVCFPVDIWKELCEDIGVIFNQKQFNFQPVTFLTFKHLITEISKFTITRLYFDTFTSNIVLEGFIGKSQVKLILGKLKYRHTITAKSYLDLQALGRYYKDLPLTTRGNTCEWPLSYQPVISLHKIKSKHYYLDTLAEQTILESVSKLVPNFEFCENFTFVLPNSTTALSQVGFEVIDLVTQNSKLFLQTRSLDLSNYNPVKYPAILSNTFSIIRKTMTSPVQQVLKLGNSSSEITVNIKNSLIQEFLGLKFHYNLAHL